MNENLKTTIVLKLANMTDETGRQLLDYMEFLESRFNRSTRERSTLERIAENVEGTLRSNALGEAAFKGTGGIIDAAGSVARSVAAAGQAVLDEFQNSVGEGRAKQGGAEKSKDTTEAVDSSNEKSEEPTPPPASEEVPSDVHSGGEKTSA